MRSGVRAGVAIAQSQNVARDLSNEPANTLPPAALARHAQRVARQVGLRCQVLGVPQLKKPWAWAESWPSAAAAAARRA